MRLSQKVSVNIVFIMPLVFTKLIQRISKTLDEDKIKSILDCLEMVSCGYKERKGFEEYHAKMITSMSKCIEQAEEDNEVVVNKRQQLDYQSRLKFLLADLEKCRDVTYKACGKQRDEKTTVHEDYDDIVTLLKSEVSQIVQFIVHESCQISNLLHKSIEEENKPEIRESRIFGRNGVTLRCKAVTDAEEDFNTNEKGTYKCKTLHAGAKKFMQTISIDILGAFKNDCLAFNKLEGMENIKEEIFDNIDATVARLKFFGRYFTAYSMYCQRIDLNAVHETYFEANKAFDVLYGIISSDYIKKNIEAKESLLSSKKAMYEVKYTKLDHVLGNLHKLGTNKIVSEWVMSLTTRSFFTIFTKSEGKECRHESVKPAVKIPNHFEPLINVFKVYILTYTRLMCEGIALNKEMLSVDAEEAIISLMIKKALFKARMAAIAFKKVGDDNIIGGDLFIIAKLPEYVAKAIGVVFTMQNSNDFYGEMSQHLDLIHLRMKVLSDKFQKTIDLLIEQYESEQGRVHKMKNPLDANIENLNAKTLVVDFKNEFFAVHKMIDDNLERLCEAITLRYNLKSIQDEGSVIRFDTYSNVPKMKQQETCPTSFELANRASLVADNLQILIEKTEQSILHEKTVLDDDLNKTKNLLDHTVFLLDTIACTYKQRHEKTNSRSQFELDEKDIDHIFKDMRYKEHPLRSAVMSINLLDNLSEFVLSVSNETALVNKGSELLRDIEKFDEFTSIASKAQENMTTSFANAVISYFIRYIPNQSPTEKTLAQIAKDGLSIIMQFKSDCDQDMGDEDLIVIKSECGYVSALIDYVLGINNASNNTIDKNSNGVIIKNSDQVENWVKNRGYNLQFFIETLEDKLGIIVETDEKQLREKEADGTSEHEEAREAANDDSIKMIVKAFETGVFKKQDLSSLSKNIDYVNGLAASGNSQNPMTNIVLTSSEGGKYSNSKRLDESNHGTHGSGACVPPKNNISPTCFASNGQPTNVESKMNWNQITSSGCRRVRAVHPKQSSCEQQKKGNQCVREDQSASWERVFICSAISGLALSVLCMIIYAAWFW